MHECSDPGDNNDSDNNSYSDSEDGLLHLHNSPSVKEDAATVDMEVILLCI